MPAVARACELEAPRLLLPVAQLGAASDQIQVRREPRDRQIAEQVVDERRLAIQVHVERVTGRDARRAAAGKQAEDHALDGDALLVQRTLVLVRPRWRPQTALERRLALPVLHQALLCVRWQPRGGIRRRHRMAQQQRVGNTGDVAPNVGGVGLQPDRRRRPTAGEHHHHRVR
jgi:hypothetical protein